MQARNVVTGPSPIKRVNTTQGAANGRRDVSMLMVVDDSAPVDPIPATTHALESLFSCEAVCGSQEMKVARASRR